MLACLLAYASSVCWLVVSRCKYIIFSSVYKVAIYPALCLSSCPQGAWRCSCFPGGRKSIRGLNLYHHSGKRAPSRGPRWLLLVSVAMMCQAVRWLFPSRTQFTQPIYYRPDFPKYAAAPIVLNQALAKMCCGSWTFIIVIVLPNWFLSGSIA